MNDIINLVDLAKADFTTMNQAIGMIKTQQKILKTKLCDSIKNNDIDGYNKIISYFPKLLEKDTKEIYHILQEINNPNIVFLEHLLSHDYFLSQFSNELKNHILEDLYNKAVYNLELFHQLEKSTLYDEQLMTKIVNVSILDDTITGFDIDVFNQLITNNFYTKNISTLKYDKLVIKLIDLDNVDKLHTLFCNNMLVHIDNDLYLQHQLLNHALQKCSPNTTDFLLKRYNDNHLYKTITMSDIVGKYENKQLVFFISQRERHNSFRNLVLSEFIIDEQFLHTFPKKLSFAKEPVWFEVFDYVISKKNTSLVESFLIGVQNSSDKKFKESMIPVCEKSIAYFNLEKSTYNNKDAPKLKI